MNTIGIRPIPWDGPFNAPAKKTSFAKRVYRAVSEGK